MKDGVYAGYIDEQKSTGTQWIAFYINGSNMLL